MLFLADACCKCIELKSGCFFIGYYLFITSVIWIVELLRWFGDGAPLILNKSLITLTTAQAWILLFTYILFFFFVLLLIIGLHKERGLYIKVYLIFGGIVCTVCVIDFFLTICKYRLTWQYVTTNVISLPLMLYFWWVIFSYYKNLTAPRRPVPTNVV